MTRYGHAVASIDVSYPELWLREHRADAIPPEVIARLNTDGTLRPEVAPS